MAFNLNDFGSIADALTVYRDDVADTLKNIGNVLGSYTDAILSIEDDNINVDTTKFPINLVFNDENISITSEQDGFHLYNGNGIDKGVLFDTVNHKINENIIGYNPYQILDSINASYSSNEILMEACDLALTNDDPDTDIAAMLGSKYGPQAASLSSAAKESLDTVQTYLQHTDKGPTGVAGFMSELYLTIRDTIAGDDGIYYQSADRPWRIQGFVGSYLISSIVKTSAQAIQMVITICRPIIGIAVGALFGALSVLRQVFVDYTSSEVKVNDRVTNNMLNMSMFDYDLQSNQLPAYVGTFFTNHEGLNSVSYRMPGCTWIFTRPVDGFFHLQIMCNIEFNTVYTNALGSYNLDNSTYTTVANSGSLPSPWTDGYRDYFYKNVRVTRSYQTAVIQGNNTYDAQARSSIMCAYQMLFGMMAAMTYGHNYTDSCPNSMPSTANSFLHAGWTYLHRVSSDNSWSSIVQYRNSLRQISFGGELCQLFQNLQTFFNISADSIIEHMSFPWVSKFYMEVPSYTSGAVWASILAVAALGAIAITTAVIVHKVKVKVKKFMARKQLDIEANRYAYENASAAQKDAAFNTYWDSMRNFNKWTLVTRYDKIDMMTGYMASSNDTTTNGGYGINLNKEVKNLQGNYQTIDLTDIYKLIAGS